MIGDDLIAFVDGELFPYLRSFRQTATGPRTIHYKIGEVFTELRSKFRSGYIRLLKTLVRVSGFLGSPVPLAQTIWLSFQPMPRLK